MEDFDIGRHFPIQGAHSAIKVFIRTRCAVPIPNVLDTVVKNMVNHFSFRSVLSSRYHRHIGVQSVDSLPLIEWSGICDIQRHRVTFPDCGMSVAEHDLQRLPICLQKYGFWPLAEGGPIHLQDNTSENKILSPHPSTEETHCTDDQQRLPPEGTEWIP